MRKNKALQIEMPEFKRQLVPMDIQVSSWEGDSRLKRDAFHFLRCNLSRLRTAAQFREAFQGLLAAQQILSPQDVNYRRSLADMQKTLATFAKHFAVGPDLAEQLNQVWQKAVDLLAEAVPSDKWRVNESELRTMFLKHLEG